MTALLHTAVGYKGYMYSLVCVDDSYSAFVDVQVGETLAAETGPFELFIGEYINVVSDDANWIVAR